MVDNASADGSAAAVREEFPNVRLIENSTNVGFGAANNQAMAQAQGEFILLLNSDAFPEPDAIGALVRYLKEHPDVGAVGPRTLNRDGSLQQSCFRFPSPIRCWMENLWIYSLIRHHPVISDYRYWPHDADRAVDFVIGACVLIRRQCYEEVGAFDEQFFMYSEEIDWQHRMWARGWKVAFTPSSRVTHLGGASGATDKGRIKRHFFDSLDYYEWKHHGLPGVIAVRLAMSVGCMMRAVLWGAVTIASPARRALASSKLKLHLWLVRRQLTHWRLNFARSAPRPI